VNLDRLGNPVASVELHAVEHARIARRRESRRAVPEEVRCLLHTGEQRAPLKPLRHADVDADAGHAIDAGESHMEVLCSLADVEGRTVVLARKQAAARDGVHQ